MYIYIIYIYTYIYIIYIHPCDSHKTHNKTPHVSSVFLATSTRAVF